MVKKSQLKKYNVERIMELVQKETDGEQLKMMSEALNQKNKAIIEKKGQLVSELDEIRRQLQKVFWEMNDGVKDRIQLKAKVVMDKNSRPSSDDIKEITEMFAHLEQIQQQQQNQHNLIKRNSQDLQQYGQTLRQAIAALQPKSSKRADPTDLDEQFLQLNQQCARQEIVKQQLINERQANRKHYNSISSSIEQYRIEYDFVEDRIRQKQRELVQLTSYLSMRKSEDESILNQLRNSNMQLQCELLKAQEILNSNSQICESLMMREIQSAGRPSL